MEVNPDQVASECRQTAAHLTKFGSAAFKHFIMLVAVRKNIFSQSHLLSQNKWVQQKVQIQKYIIQPMHICNMCLVYLLLTHHDLFCSCFVTSFAIQVLSKAFCLCVSGFLFPTLALPAIWFTLSSSSSTLGCKRPQSTTQTWTL